MRSLRARLLWGTALGSAAVLFLAGLAIHAMVRTLLYAEFDNALRAKAYTLAGLAEQEGRHIELEFVEAEMSEFERDDRPEYFEVWRVGGDVVACSPSLGEQNLPRLNPQADHAVIQSLDLPDGRPGRMIAVRALPQVDSEYPLAGPRAELEFVLARDVQDPETALTDLRIALAIIGVLAVAASVGVLACLVPIGLRPADRLAATISQIDEQRLADRIELADTPTELQPIVRRVNELLERLDAALLREKAMTADVAHELRTPLAGLTATLEVALSRERDSQAYREAMSACLYICRQTQTLVENLLTLTRLDTAPDLAVHQRTDVETLLRRTWEPFAAPAAAKNLHIAWDIEPNLELLTDATQLGLVFRNVFENTVNYTNDGGCVSVHCAKDGDAVQIRVINSGSHVAGADAEHVFERFWRGDDAREKTDAHCGLGLSLCERVVDHLGGTISAVSEEGGAFTVTLRF